MVTISVDKRERADIDRARKILERLFQPDAPPAVAQATATLRRLIAKYDYPDVWRQRDDAE